MTIKIKTIILFFRIATLLNAQQTGSINGMVVDINTQEPLIGTNVQIIDTNKGTATDMEGKYVIKNVPVGTYRLKFDYIGYESQIKTDVVVISARPVTVNAQMEQSIVEGETVTVIAGYFTQEEQVQPSTTSLSREEIRRFPGGFEDVVRTISTLPGVAINNTGGRNDLLVRGGGPSENLYLIDNIEVPNINHFGTPGNSGGSLSFVNLDFVEDVTFSTGGFGARYGDKMSSVIALTLLKKRPENIETKATISATQFGFDMELPISSRGNFIFSARKSYLDLIFKAAGLPFVPVYTDFNVITNIDLSLKDRLFILGLSAINNVDRNQSSLKNRVFNAGLLDNSQYRGIGGINYQRLFSKGYLDVTASLNLTRFKFKQIDEEEIPYFTSNSDEWESSLKVQNYWSPTKRINLLTGVMGKWFRNDNTTVFSDTIYDRSGNRIPIQEIGLDQETDIDVRAEKLSAFIEMDLKLTNNFEMNAGLRLDHYGYINKPTYLAPRLALKYRPHPLHEFRISGGEYYQSPSYVWTANPSNNRLRALENRMAVFGYDFLIKDDLRLTFETYHKDYSNLPTGTLPGVNDYIVINNTGTGYGGREDDFQSFAFYTLTSTGKGVSYGSELVLQKKYSDTPLYGLMSLTYNQTEVTAANGMTYPGLYDQRWILNLSGGYVLNDKWEFSAKFRYFTGIPYTPVYRPSENPIQPGVIQNLPEEYLSARLDAGHHLDIRVDRYFNFSRWTLITYVDIQNVYNYKLPLRPQYDFWKDTIDDSGNIGILPSIGISAEF